MTRTTIAAVTLTLIAALAAATPATAAPTPGVVINPGTGSPNLLLYMGMVPM